MMLPSEIKASIQELLAIREKPGRMAVSTRYPELAGTILFIKRTVRSTRNLLNPGLIRSLSTDFLTNIVCRHQSVLFRKLGDSDQHLQNQKVINLKMAVQKLNGLVIPPGKTFSFWYAVGKPAYHRGYVDGMLLANGKVVEGIGGGLCQLSNLIYWLFLHSPLTVTERHRHGYDVFPDSGRVLPFGSGATIMYNTIDLRALNNTDTALQLKIWLTDTHLKGQILSSQQVENKYHIFEKYHCFIFYKGEYYRYNEIWREVSIRGQQLTVEKITTNFAPVMYEVDEAYLKQDGFQLWHIKGKKWLPVN